MLPWTCTKCGTRHETEVQAGRCRADERSLRRLAISIMVALAVILMAVDLWWNHYAYGDWRCAYARCVKVVR